MLSLLPALLVTQSNPGSVLLGRGLHGVDIRQQGSLGVILESAYCILINEYLYQNIGWFVLVFWYFLIYMNALVLCIFLVNLPWLLNFTFGRISMLKSVLGHSFWLLCSIPLWEYTQIIYPLWPWVTFGSFLIFQLRWTSLCTWVRSFGNGISRWFAMPAFSVTGCWLICLPSSWTTKVIQEFSFPRSIIIFVLFSFLPICVWNSATF